MRGHADDDRRALSRAWHRAETVELYERGRPGWPRDLLAALPLPEGPKLDLAAGTGKLTRLLDAPVHAVDPSEPMLERLRAEAPHAEARLGHAEAIPLEDGAVEAVLVATLPKRSFSPLQTRESGAWRAPLRGRFTERGAGVARRGGRRHPAASGGLVVPP